MKYLTPERYVALQDFSGEAAMDDADAAWEEAVNRYDNYLQQVCPSLPPSVANMVERYYLHNAKVLSMGLQENDFVMLLQDDAPPYNLVLIRFNLAGQPKIDREALPPQFRASSPLWLHEEVEVVCEGSPNHVRFSILLANGWELTLPVFDLTIQTLSPLFPLPQNGASPSLPTTQTQTTRG